MITHCNQTKTKALILLIDFKKAFDSLDQTFMQSCLKMLGFGADIREWIRLFFTGREAHILLGGHLTNKIHLDQGVPQGDVVSPYIFILMVELLLIKINYTKNIEGIKFALLEGRSETFADDTTIYMKRTEHNLRTCVQYIEHFAKVSGLQCNIDKTVVCPIGGNFDVNDRLCPELPTLKWEDRFTILGFEIDSKLEHLSNNYELVHAKVDKMISKWQCYKLTIMGRITITKSLLLSQYTYVGSVLDMTEFQTDLIQNKLNAFVLHNKRYIPNETLKQWVKPEVLYGTTSQGADLQNYADAADTSA